MGIPATIASFNIILGYVFAGIKIWALVDAASHSKAAFEFIGRMNKIFWLVFLGLAVLIQFASVSTGWSSTGLLNLVGLILALVYLVDMRPKLKDLKK
ncbi:MAG: hypothetical protein RL677_598 [Actinomycetota bacterium]